MSDFLDKIKTISESILFASHEPMSLDKLLKVFEEDEKAPSRDELKSALASLAEDYHGRGVELAEVASGFQFRVNKENSIWLKRLWEERPPRYSRALLETLVLIAYRQPVTRAEIEDVRGVAVSSHIVKTLLEREWVRVVGHKDVPGKPAMFATTKQFLDYFNLKKLSDLPPLNELADLENAGEQLEIELQAQNSPEALVALESTLESAESLDGIGTDFLEGKPSELAVNLESSDAPENEPEVNEDNSDLTASETVEVEP